MSKDIAMTMAAKKQEQGHEPRCSYDDNSSEHITSLPIATSFSHFYQCFSMPRDSYNSVNGKPVQPLFRHNSDNVRLTKNLSLLVLLVLLLSSTQLGQIALKGGSLLVFQAANQARGGNSLFLLAQASPITTNLVYPNSQYGCNGKRSSEGERLLCMLRYEIKPIIDLYKQAYGDAKPEDQRMRDLIELSDQLEKFTSVALNAVDQSQYCLFGTINELSELKRFSQNKILSKVYDMMAIEYHKSCFLSIIGKLPSVPNNIHEIVQIYIDGADHAVLDLNTSPQDEHFSLDQFGGNDSDEPFDVDKAIQRSGSLDQVLGLSLWSPLGGGSESERPKKFIEDCRKFLGEIESRWQPMEIMNTMLDTEGCSIRRLNNYIVRRLAPTKYADICSQISSRYESSS